MNDTTTDKTNKTSQENTPGTPDAPDPDKGFLFVKDINAKPGKVRTHNIIIAMHIDVNELTGEETTVVDEQLGYNLSSNQACRMPEVHAMQFLRDKSFIVSDSKGVRIKPVEKKDVDTGKIVLEFDEVVAKYDELMREALYKRCKIIPGTDHITKASKKDVMVECLISHEEKRKNIGLSRGSEGLVSDNANLADSLLDMGPVDNAVDPKSIVKSGAQQSALAQVNS